MSNIASGLCGSFVSRNNTLDGYWSIGKTRTLADEHGQTTVLFDMLTLATQPPSSGIATLTARCYRLLAKLAELSRIPLEEVTVARIAVDFAPPPWPRARYYNDASPFMAWINGCLLFRNLTIFPYILAAELHC